VDADLPAEHFDVVTGLASFHHMPFPEAASEVRRVLGRGGRLVLLGVWTDRCTISDLAWAAASAALHELLVRRRGPDSMTTSATLEQTSWHQVRAHAATHLPGVRLRRRLLWRCALVWDKPLGR
jgi:ubiquinone/menaquinone biosynthesis C-methylase UbiE